MSYDESMFVPPWHEWSNDFINNEKWDQFNDQRVFRHPCGHERLPVEVTRRVKTWRRPNEIFGYEGLAVQSKEDNNDIQNLLTVNESLMDVKIYRWILYNIVLYTGRFKNRWPQPWHPSSLVFSCCKAEKAWNKKSKPEFNPFGKYWLKLFFMGKFRMICVTDHLPVSNENTILLPLCENNKVLWLPLLVKGLLRIYALVEQFNQFNTITCLTGWSCIRKNIKHVSKEDVWSSILSHSSYSVLEIERPDGESKNKKSSQNLECFPILTTEGIQCYRNKCISNYEANPPNSIVIAAILSPTTCKVNKTDPLQRYLQPIFFNNVKMLKNKSIATWKKIRWTKWAIENNIIRQHEVCEFMKSVNVYAPCTTILSHTCPLMKLFNEYKVFEDESIFELDFTYLEPYTKYIEFYIKPSQAFPFTKSITVRDEDDHNNSSIESQKITLSNNNCCVYLHFESPHCESMLFTLSVCKDYTIDNSNGQMVLDASSDVTKTVINPYINVERFFWYETKLPTPLLSIRTRGVSNEVLKLEPGVNVLKMYGELPAKYSLTVESTVEFSVHRTVHTVYEKLVDQPKLLASFLVPIKELLLQLCATEPNSGDRGQKLLKFYSSFMPPCVSQENELKKVERYSTISKPVQTAVVECTEHKFPNSWPNMTEVYVEIQELFQNKSLGLKQILDFNEKLKLSQLDEINQIKKKVPNEKTMTIKKSMVKPKSPNNNKHASPVNPPKSYKQMLSKCLHDNMFEIVWNVLNSVEIDLDEYYLKNDLFSYMVNITYDDNTMKQIDPLLLFRLDLNTHSTFERAPTIIQFLHKNNNSFCANLTLVDNDTRLEVLPANSDANTYMVNRTSRGYTLLGWSPEQKDDDKYNHSSYKLSFFGRPHQILHACGARNDNFYNFNTTVCENANPPDFVTRYVRDKFRRPNNDHALTRVLLNVENAAPYTIYCRLERLDDAAVELRVVDYENSSKVFASSQACGKTALIPAVFLDPNYDNTLTFVNDGSENSTNVTFVIEVILIKDIEIVYDYALDNDVTIACAYDQKFTDIVMETDLSVDNFRFVSSIPRQVVVAPLSVNSTRKSMMDKKSELRNSTTSKKIETNENTVPTLNHYQVMESMMMNQKISGIKITPDDTTSILDEENLLNEISEKQSFTNNLIRKELESNNRQFFMEDFYNKILAFHNLQHKSNMNIKKSRITRKN